MRFVTIGLPILLGLMPTLAVANEPPAALVMAVTGSTTPSLAPMSEIASGASIKLAPGAELTLLDYARCKMVQVSGGTVTVSRFDFVADGKIISQTDAPCPRVHKLSAAAAGSVAGGLVMRGVGSAPRWPLNREFVVVGDEADALKAAAIYAEGKLDAPLVRLNVAAHRMSFPIDSAALPVNERYVLRLTMAGRADPVDISFIGAAPSGPSLVVVLRDQ